MVDLFETDILQASRLRDDGIKHSEVKANKELPGWSDMALEALREFIAFRADSFMVEDVRNWATWVPKPHSNRAWGGIIKKAIKAGLVQKSGYGMTKNPSAHRTPAATWIRMGEL